jgi:hypothetical protein
MSRKIAVGLFVILLASAFLLAAAQDTSSWKHYRNSEYGLEIAYPTHWQFIAGDADKIDKPPADGRHPAHAGETRGLFGLEIDGPTQSPDGGGSFDDGAIVTVSISGASGVIEDWNMKPDSSWYLRQSTPSDWVKRLTSIGAGDGLKKVPVDTNEFKGEIAVVCIGKNPCKIFEEIGGAYRTLPSGRVLFVSWDREAGGNDFSFQKYLLPMLSSFKMLK